MCAGLYCCTTAELYSGHNSAARKSWWKQYKNAMNQTALNIIFLAPVVMVVSQWLNWTASNYNLLWRNLLDLVNKLHSLITPGLLPKEIGAHKIKVLCFNKRTLTISQSFLKTCIRNRSVTSERIWQFYVWKGKRGKCDIHRITGLEETQSHQLQPPSTWQTHPHHPLPQDQPTWSHMLLFFLD